MRGVRTHWLHPAANHPARCRKQCVFSSIAAGLVCRRDIVGCAARHVALSLYERIPTSLTHHRVPIAALDALDFNAPWPSATTMRPPPLPAFTAWRFYADSRYSLFLAYMASFYFLLDKSSLFVRLTPYLRAGLADLRGRCVFPPCMSCGPCCGRVHLVTWGARKQASRLTKQARFSSFDWLPSRRNPPGGARGPRMHPAGFSGLALCQRATSDVR
jgi:hypothetical protein